MEPELVLHGVFLHLTRQGFRLGVRDYVDALEALRAGFGLHDRARLLWLCQTLWARSEAEARRIALLFGQFPEPSAAEVAAVRGERPSPDTAAAPETPPGAPRSTGTDAASGEPRATIHFAPPGATGLGLPRAQIALDPAEPFILTPPPLIPLRNLVIIWRRFRTALRTGPKTELDIAATVAEQSRAGWLTGPRLVAPRRNQARLTLLVDVSPSMMPWHSVITLLPDSLRHSQFREAALYYFDNLPDEVLYRTESQTGPVTLKAALERHAGTPLLILGDGGAARGARNPDRIRETQAFLKRISGAWRPIAWINPMPRHRWRRTSFEAVTRARGVAAFGLTEDELIRAIDVLRGRREA